MLVSCRLWRMQAFRYALAPRSRCWPHVICSDFCLLFRDCILCSLQPADAILPQVVSVMGTSAGAITGSLYASGLSPFEVAEELSRLPPKDFLVCPYFHAYISLSATHGFRQSISACQCDHQKSELNHSRPIACGCAHALPPGPRISRAFPFAGHHWIGTTCMR